MAFFNRLGLVRARACLVGLFGTASLLVAQSYNPPAGYYTSATGLLGEPLRTALHDVIDNHSALNYLNDLPVLWRVTEVDQNNPNNILLIYSGSSAANTPAAGNWNREHSWPQSYGAGTGSAYSDAHHIFPCNAVVNETRSNYIFDHVVFGVPVPGAPDSLVDTARSIFEPRDADKGLIARAQLYIDLRYDATDPEGDLQLTDFPNSSLKRFARQTTLLEWNRKFPPSERERMRNHVIYNGFFSGNKLIRQGNRNPFIDFPELADAIHTSGDYITWGSWRVSHFSFDQLLDGAVSGDLADPEGDSLPNLLELAQNSDPLEPTLSGLPRITDNEVNKLFTFTRVRRYERSYLAYTVEYSEFPLLEDSWTEAVVDASNAGIAAMGMLETVTFHGTGLPSPQRPRHYRLKVAREAAPGEWVMATFDPVRHEEPDSVSLFLYARDVDATWKLSDWFGYVEDQAFPWVYHANHTWMYVQHSDESSIFLYDTALGWLWTAYGFYPALYSYDAGKWLYHVAGSNAPGRWFFDYAANNYVFETEL